MMPDSTDLLLDVLSATAKKPEPSDTSEEGENAERPELSPAPDEKGSISSTQERGRGIFSSRSTHPVVLDVLLLDQFGPNWLEWESETLWSEIHSSLSPSISLQSQNKIQALKTLHVVDTPWTQWEVFLVVAMALNDNIPDFRVLQKPTLAELIAAIKMMGRIREHSFSEEVAKFVAATCLEDGVYFLPPPLEFAQYWTARPMYECRRCGKVDVDDDNEVCDSCGAPQNELVVLPTHDPEPVKRRWEQVLRDGQSRDYYLEENPIDVQVAKLLSAFGQAEQIDRDLKEQLEHLRGHVR